MAGDPNRKDGPSFEDELAGLRPRAPSARLSDQIALQLTVRGDDDNSPFPSPAIGVPPGLTVPAASRQPQVAPGLNAAWRLGVATALAASLLVAVLLTLGEHGPGGTEPSEGILQTGQPPTRMTYQQALAESPEMLDDLLDAHASRIALQEAHTPQAGDSLPSADGWN